MLAAGLGDHDPAQRYGIDVFTQPIPEGEPRTVALSYVGFARVTERLDPTDVFDRYPELVACLDPDAPGFGAAANRLGDLLRRHAREAVGAVARMYARLSADLTRGHLPATSLLVLLGGRDEPTPTAPRVTPSVRSGDRAAAGLDEASTAGSSFGAPAAGAPNEFRHRLGVWHVAFRGDKGTFPHAKGMTQLALLLRWPKQPLDVVALARCEAVPQSGGSVGDGFSPGIGGDLGPVLGEEQLRELRKHIRELPARIRSARAAGRADQAAALTEELAAARRFLRTAQRLGGGPRDIGGPAERARKALSKNVRACLDLIAVDLAALHEHLLRFLHLGVPPSYDPDPPERWRVEW